MLGSFEIIIPVYEARSFLQDLLSMIAQHYPQRKLTLVDDCSKEETARFLDEYAKKENTELLRRPSRGWFTRAANTGLRHVLGKSPGPDWVIVMNSDCTVGAGAFEELEMVWHLAEKEAGKPIGLVGADGPKPHCPRWRDVKEQEYVTGHCLLLSTDVMKKQDLLFPWRDGQVRGFSAGDLTHIASDRALSWEFNRRGFATVVSYWCAIGHYGGKSWNHVINTWPAANCLQD